MKKFKAALASIMLLSVSGTALATEAGTWAVSIGAHVVDPQNDAADDLGIEVGSSFRPTVTAEYFISDNIGVELLASWPFNHELSVGGTEVASVKHLPPTLSVQYHFNENGDFQPFIGASLNYTLFFDEDTQGALTGVDLNLKNSFGVGAHAGVDFAVSDDMFLRADIRWIDIDTEVNADGAVLGTANLDPLIYGVAVVKTF